MADGDNYSDDGFVDAGAHAGVRAGLEPGPGQRADGPRRSEPDQGRLLGAPSPVRSSDLLPGAEGARGAGVGLSQGELGASNGYRSGLAPRSRDREAAFVGVDVDAIMRGVREGVVSELPRVVDALAAAGLTSSAQGGPASGTRGKGFSAATHSGIAVAADAYAGSAQGGKRRPASAAAKRSGAATDAQGIPATLPARLSRQVASLRRLVRSQEDRIVALSRDLASERRSHKLQAAAATASAAGEAAVPPQTQQHRRQAAPQQRSARAAQSSRQGKARARSARGDGRAAPASPAAPSPEEEPAPGARVLQTELSRAHSEVASTSRQLAATRRQLAEARQRLGREADRADRAEAAAKAAEAAAAAYETGFKEAEAAVGRMVAPLPEEGDDVEVQTQGSLTSTPGTVTWRRGRVVAVRGGGATAVYTVRLDNGRVEQRVEQRHLLLRVPPAEAEAAKRTIREAVLGRREEDHADEDVGAGAGAGAGAESGGGTRRTAGSPGPGSGGRRGGSSADEESPRGPPRRLVRAGFIVRDEVEGGEQASELEQRWVSAVLARRCRSLAADNVRLQSQLALLMREIGMGGGGEAGEEEEAAAAEEAAVRDTRGGKGSGLAEAEAALAAAGGTGVAVSGGARGAY